MQTNKLINIFLGILLFLVQEFVQAQNVPLGDAIRNRNVQIYKDMNLNTLPSPAQQGASTKRFFEGHWHGLELIRLSRELRQEYDIPNDVTGLLIDEVTLEATECGFLAGDVVQAVDGYPTPTLREFLKASMQAQNKTKVKIDVVRSAHAQALSGDIGIKDFNNRAQTLAAPQKIQRLTLVLQIADYYNNLGYANMDAAPPIQPGAISPHKDRGRVCAECHVFMNTGGQLAVDAGDIVPDPPAIIQGSPCPHETRGTCNFCHRVINSRDQGQSQQANTSTVPGGTAMVFSAPVTQATDIASQTVPVVNANSPTQITGPDTALQSVGQVNVVDSLNNALSQSSAPKAGAQGVLWQGVQAISVTPEMAQQFSLPNAAGVYVVDVAPDSPFRWVGIERGDVITHLGQIAVRDASHFNELVAQLRTGNKIDVEVMRKGKPYTFNYQLREKYGLPQERYEERQFSSRTIGILAILALIYFLIFNNVLGRMISFPLGAVLVLVLGYHFEFYNITQAFKSINYSVIMFFVGMSFIAAVLNESNMFKNIANFVTVKTNGSRTSLFFLMCITTYICAAIMDNLTTMLVFVPLTLKLAKDRHFDAKPLVIAEIIAANLGGASTMFGDFPNLLITLSTKLSFFDFIIYEMPVCIVMLGAMFVYMWFSNNSFFLPLAHKNKHAFDNVDLETSDRAGQTVPVVVDTKKLVPVFIVMGLAFIGMIISAQASGFIALAAGLIVLAIGPIDRLKIFKQGGWVEVIFLCAMFIIVGAAEASGILSFIAHKVILNISGGNLLAMAIITMVLAAIITVFMNAGPTTALFIPVVLHFGIQTPNNLFWWALSLGVVSGASASLYGSTTGPLVSTMLTNYWNKIRHKVDEKSPFASLALQLDMKEYLKTGIPIMGIFLVISIAYITILHFYF